MACVGPLPSTSKHDRDDCQRDGGRGQELMLEDEFTCAGALRGALIMLQPSVERIFGVKFRVGTGEDDDLTHSDGQIWLKLNGQTKNVSAAKLFVKGVVNQEEQQEVSYPGVLHCVFCGARGLFMDCLIKNTSAHIVVGSLGCLLISGLTEPVVKAFSLITDLVNRYQSAQGPRTVSGDWGPGEFLDSRRAFKHLVERCNDGSTLDLLVLPGTVKESLLDLVKESGLRSNAGLVVSAGEGELGSIPQTSESSRGLFITDGRELNVEVGELREMAHGLQHNRIIDYFHQDSTHVRDPHARLHSPGGSSLESPFWTADGREQQGDGIRKGSTADPLFHSFPERENNSRHAEQASRDQTEFRGQSPQEVGEEGEPGEGKKEEEHGESVGSKKEFGLLLKFFTAMGYTEDVVMSVLARTGPKEASQILDLVQQEQDRSDRKQSRNRPSETEHVEEKRDAMGAGRSDMAARKRNTDRKENRPGLTAGDEGAGRDPDFGEVAEVGRDRGGGRDEEEEEEEKYGGNREDFVLGVLKRAAATCGYTEQKVEEVYGMLPGNSTHQLLLELQREGAREAQRPTAVGGMRRGEEEPREVDEAALEAQRELNRGGRMEEEVVEQSVAHAEREEAIRSRKERKTMGGERGDHPKQTVALPEPSEWIARNRLSAPQPAWLPAAKLDTRAPQIKGPPQHTYSSALDPKANQSARKTPQPSQPTPPLPNVDPQLFQHPKPALQPTYLASSGPFHNPSKFLQPTKPDPQPMSPALFKFVSPQPAPLDLPASRERNKLGLPAVPSGAVVTGEQRFLESLQTPFELKLTNDPGDPGLRGIIIDGSNVAMSHGRGYFFSCRGIALAVQHFWNRGHREITTFLPQWRQKRDHRVKEHHFLTELQNLGMISYTPSREFEGKKISSYDDRFMLQLAEKTDGVIVTNDNLRDLVDESRGFRDIIKKGLLQYTFVDNLFMVPDDPLGRGGPHLDDFLHSQNRTPIPGNHSFAGLASSFTSPKTNCSQTEVLQLRDRTLMAPAKPEFSQQGHQRGKGQDKASPHSARQRQRTGLDAGLQRSEKDTAILREQLCQVFPGQDSMVALVLQSNHTEKDINILSDFILEQQGESQMEH